MKSFDCTVRLRMISSLCNISQSFHQKLNVNCKSVMIVLGTPQQVIQEKTKVCVYAAADLSERGIASIHLDV